MLAIQASAREVQLCKVQLWKKDSTEASDAVWVSPGNLARLRLMFGNHNFYLYAKTSGECQTSPVSDGPSRWGENKITGTLHWVTEGTVKVQTVSMEEVKKGYPLDQH
ncbi:hypothetical protein PgNI_05379 [Pyricularia grisea]|uniref:Uncharacterized protein n=1 Tax=Pyricularia grisea TaxID=148305 RepID=A0A6P8B5V2_PYRGI|nr:hypothetical protein PgNI_05379 [Pyricularia grisea]TLD10509.1 hypothetical protein PgNI_05379 [Pyricularia grisea]